MLAFILFAAVSSITPGPTNLLVMGHSARHGWRACVPIIFGACLGAAGIVLASGTALGQLLLEVPGVAQAMSWVGAAWLSWLAWTLLRAPVEALQGRTASDLGFWRALALQVVNPKTWVMAIATVSLFAAGAPSPLLRVAQLAAVFLLIALPCMACWAALGVGAARWLRSPQALRRMNQSLAILLLFSCWSALLSA